METFSGTCTCQLYRKPRLDPIHEILLLDTCAIHVSFAHQHSQDREALVAGVNYLLLTESEITSDLE